MSSLIHSIRNVLGNIAKFLVGLPALVVDQVQYVKEFLSLIKEKIQNLYATNLDLGIYHLQNGCFKDAILRFHLIDWIFSPGDKRAKYLLGWCYFLSNKKEKAIDCLKQAGKYDKNNLLGYLTDCVELQNIPEKITQEYHDLVYKTFFTQSKIKLASQFMAILFENIAQLSNDCRILDLGCNMGIIGTELQNKISGNHLLIGTESSMQMVRFTQGLCNNKFKVYDQVINQSVGNFLSNKNELFDIIISNNSLSIFKNLSDHFQQIFTHLKPSGYFFCVVPIAKNANLSQNMCFFYYKREKIENWLIKANFRIIFTKELTNMRVRYLVIVSDKESSLS